MKLLMSALLVSVIFSSFCADGDTLILRSAVVRAKQEGLPDQMFQNSGIIRFNPDLFDNLASRKIVAEIHYYCGSPTYEKVSTAEGLFTQIPRTTDDQKLLYCVAAMRLGEAHLKLCNNIDDQSDDAPDKAMHYFTEAWGVNHFTGAALKLAFVQCFYNHDAVLYYLLQAKKAGFVGDPQNESFSQLDIEDKEQALLVMEKVLVSEEAGDEY